MRRHFTYLLIFSLIMLYFETILHIHVMGLSLGWRYARVAAFSVGYATFLWALVRIFKPQRAMRLLGVFIGLLTVLFLSLDVYYQIMGDFYSIFMGGDVLLGITFLGRFFTNLQLYHVLYLIPLTLFFIQLNKIHILKYRSIFEPLLIVSFAFLWIMVGLQLINPNPLFTSDSPFNYSERDIYEKRPSAYQVIEEFGVLTYLRLDIQNLNQEPVDSNEALDTFLETRTPYEPNEMTGLLEGKNVIYILAESFDEMAIHPDVSPVLTQLFERGMVFDQYYAPHYYRNTADTEFMVHTGFYPSRQVPLSMESYQDNRFSETLPRLLRDDYRTYAYHNYTDYFYPRSAFLSETIGFDVYKDALDLGLLDEEVSVGGPHLWPSDNDLFEATVDDYIHDESFFAYYLTVSGHMNYDLNHPIVAQNLPEVLRRLSPDDPALNDDALLAYYAAQMELEFMVSNVLATLLETGRIDDTVLILASDHYPYGLDEESFDTAGKPLDEMGLEIHNVPFVIYHPELPSQRIDDVFGSIDVTPTLANLLGVSYDSDRLMGQDVFASGDNTVRFQNSSILTEDYYFDIEAVDPSVSTDPSITDQDIILAFNEMIFMQDINHALLDNDYQSWMKP